MRLADFDFVLPPERIAQHPVRPRDAARLLHVAPDGLSDRIVRELPDLLHPGDILVANDTRVIPAQLEARRGQARIGLTLDRPLADGTWHALARNARRLHPGDHLDFDHNPALAATVIALGSEGDITLRFDQPDRGLPQPPSDAWRDPGLPEPVRRAARLALPPYIRRTGGPEPADACDYQTIFARNEGAVAAPTAGLHFTAGLLSALAARGIARVTITLHVGVGTFLPVRSEMVAAHRMHPERGTIGAEAAAAINATRASGGRVAAVGTTVLRLLESAAAADGSIRPFQGETDLFILPGHHFRAVDLLLTNFHLPRSTLFMLVSAFAGIDRMRAAYAHAIATGYRFYSYGDACLLQRASASVNGAYLGGRRDTP